MEIYLFVLFLFVCLFLLFFPLNGFTTGLRYVHLHSMSFCGIQLTTFTLGEGFVGGSPFNFQITFCGNFANAFLKIDVISSPIPFAIDPIEKRTTPSFPALSR